MLFGRNSDLRMEGNATRPRWSAGQWMAVDGSRGEDDFMTSFELR